MEGRWPHNFSSKSSRTQLNYIPLYTSLIGGGAGGSTEGWGLDGGVGARKITFYFFSLPFYKGLYKNYITPRERGGSAKVQIRVI